MIKRLIKTILGEIFYNCYYRYYKPTGNRILIYHAFGQKLDHDSYGISIDPELFKAHVSFIKDNYDIIAINEDYADNLDRKTVSISIDDGYRDTMAAVEILTYYDVPFTVYVSTGFIGDEEYLTKEQIVELSKNNLCTIGTHSVSHTPLSHLPLEKQMDEIQKSKIELETITGHEISQMSLPHGDYNHETLDLIKLTGYTLCASSHIGINSLNSFNKHLLRRIEVISRDDLKNLKKKIEGYYDYLNWFN